MTRQEAINNFRKQWSWMGENFNNEKSIEDLKLRFFKEKENITLIPYNFCYLCQFNKDNSTSTKSFCGSDCLIDWSLASGSVENGCMSSLFGKLFYHWNCLTIRKKVRLIYEIANLPKNLEDLNE